MLLVDLPVPSVCIVVGGERSILFDDACESGGGDGGRDNKGIGRGGVGKLALV